MISVNINIRRALDVRHGAHRQRSTEYANDAKLQVERYETRRYTR